MLQIYMIIAPSVQSEFFGAYGRLKLQVIGGDLIIKTEEVFGLEGSVLVSFTAVNAACVLRESEIQIEIRYAEDETEEGSEKVFKPSKAQKILLADSIIDAMQKPLRGIAKSVSVWVISFEDSVFKGAPIK